MNLVELIQSGVSLQRVFFIFAVAMARMGPFLMMAPFMSGRRLRRLFRDSIALGFAAFMFPWLLADAPEGTPGFWTVVPILFKESVLGLLIGMISSLPFYAATGIGYLVDNQRGMANAQADDPLSGEATSPLGSLMMETLIMVFIAGGGLAMFMQALLTSYAFWPPFSFWPDWTSLPLREMLLSQFSLYITTLFVLAFPMLLVCFLVDLGMGLMNRFAPQLNVFFLAMPIKSGLAMAVMVAYWGVLFKAIGTDVLRIPLMWDALRNIFAG